MQSDANTADAYLATLPADRRDTIAAVRKVILDNLPPGYEEIIDYGMIAYAIPLSRYPNTYNGHPLQIAALATQKNYCSLYLMTVYGHEPTKKWFEDAFKKSGKQLDMGKSCVRFQTVDDLPLDVIGETIARVTPDEYIARYEAIRGATKTKTKTKTKKRAATKKKKQVAKQQPRVKPRALKKTKIKKKKKR